MSGGWLDVGAGILRQEGQVWTRCWMGCEVLDGRVGRQDPSLLVLGEELGVVQVHLDEVLVKAIRTTAPSTVIIRKLAAVNANLTAHQSWEWFVGLRQGVEQELLALLRKFAVRFIAR